MYFDGEFNQNFECCDEYYHEVDYDDDDDDDDEEEEEEVTSLICDKHYPGILTTIILI